MMIVSSLKPLADSPTIAHNQLRAWRSWEKIADSVYYFNEPEPEMQSPKTTFISAKPFPRIKTLALAAALSPSPTCIVNADIVLAEHTKSVLEFVAKKGGKAAVSRRYQFEGEEVQNARLVDGDWGLDFFYATRGLWWKLARIIPPQYRIGHTTWDSYVLSFFNTVAGGVTWDITKRQCVFHPKHEERYRPYHIQPQHTEMMSRSGMPFNRL